MFVYQPYPSVFQLEEAALLNRLRALHVRKRQDTSYLSQSLYDNYPEYGYHSFAYDSVADLRRQVEEERSKQQALVRQYAAALRSQHLQTLLANLLSSHAGLFQHEPSSRYPFVQALVCEDKPVQHPLYRKHPNIDLQGILNQLLGPLCESICTTTREETHAAALAQALNSFLEPLITAPSGKAPSSIKDTQGIANATQQLLDALLTSAGQRLSQSQATSFRRLPEDQVQCFPQSPLKQPEQAVTSQSSPSPKVEHCEPAASPNTRPVNVATPANLLQQLFETFLEPLKQQAAKPEATSARQSLSSSPSSIIPDHLHPLGRVLDLFGSFHDSVPASKLEQQSIPSTGTSSNADSALKAELEARLNNEYESEVRDTIQAILASLQDVNPDAPRPSSSSFSTESGSKGKAKAAEPTPTAPTSADVVKSMNELCSIEAAFMTLKSDFAFPSHLDFKDDSSPKSSTPSPTDASPSRLSYTSRNHPVIFYDQALGTLTTQLDAVESFGNDDVRSKRRELLGMVEKALEELEREIEGRWKAKSAKEAKSAASNPSDSEPEAPQPETEQAQPLDVATRDKFPAIPLTDDTRVASEFPAASHPSAEPLGVSFDDTTTPVESPTGRSTPLDTPSLASSKATVKPESGTSSIASDEDDAFLLYTVQGTEVPESKLSDKDTASDWSEVEA